MNRTSLSGTLLVAVCLGLSMCATLAADANQVSDEEQPAVAVHPIDSQV